MLSRDYFHEIFLVLNDINIIVEAQILKRLQNTRRLASKLL